MFKQLLGTFSKEVFNTEEISVVLSDYKNKDM